MKNMCSAIKTIAFPSLGKCLKGIYGPFGMCVILGNVNNMEITVKHFGRQPNIVTHQVSSCKITFD